MHRQTHQPGCYLLSIPAPKEKDRFLPLFATSQNIRVVYCERQKQKDLCSNYLSNQSPCANAGPSIPRGRTKYKFFFCRQPSTVWCWITPMASLSQHGKPVPFEKRSPSKTPSSWTPRFGMKDWQTDVYRSQRPPITAWRRCPSKTNGAGPARRPSSRRSWQPQSPCLRAFRYNWVWSDEGNAKLGLLFAWG